MRSSLLALLLLASPAAADVHVWVCELDGNQVNPPVNTPGIGSATITMDDVTGYTHVIGSYAHLLGDVTQIHLHGPARGVPNSGIIFGLDHTGGMAGTFEGDDHITPARVQDLLDLKGFVNIHTTFAMGGEIRGDSQYRTELQQVALEGGQVVPPVNSPGSASAAVLLDPNDRSVTIAGTYQGLAGSATAAYLRGPAGAGQNGPILLTLNVSGGTSGGFDGGGQLGLAKFDKVLAGQAYLELETTAFPGGELRGQTGASTIGTPYCAASLSSTGSPGAIEAAGSLEVADDDVTLRAFDLPTHTFAFFVTSTASEQNGSVLGMDARLCILGAPLGRYQTQVFNSGANGEGSIQLDLSHMPVNPPVAVAPGDTWNFQCWYRDVSNPSARSNFTGAVSLTFE